MSEIEKKKVGRPKKEVSEVANKVASTQNATENVSEVKKGRGRPSKNASEGATANTSAKVKKGAKKAEEKVKMTPAERAKAKDRVDSGVKNPIGYYYEAIEKEKKAEFIEIYQMLNDKFAGRLNQTQFAAIAEQSKRIFELNTLLIEYAMETAQKLDKVKYVINLSAKWFSEEKRFEELARLVEKLPNDVFLAFDAVALGTVGQDAISGMNKLVSNYKRRIILDNVENRTLNLWLEYRPTYIRLDGRYFNPDDERYSQAIKFYREYCEAERIKIIIKEVNTEKSLRFFSLNNIEIMQGLKIHSPKKNLLTLIKDYYIM